MEWVISDKIAVQARLGFCPHKLVQRAQAHRWLHVPARFAITILRFFHEVCLCVSYVPHSKHSVNWDDLLRLQQSARFEPQQSNFHT